MFAELEGVEALDIRLAALPATLHARLEQKARELAAALADKVRDDKLSGQALAARTGALRGSISAEVAGDGPLFTASVGSRGDVKYAAIQEYGGSTPPHEIAAQKGQALAFLTGSGTRFARRVKHPGATLPARGYLLTSLDEMSDEIVAALAAAATEAWDGT